MALSKIDGTNLIAPTIPAASGGTGTTSYTSGITEADMWRLTSAFTGSVQPISSNWERCDEDTFAKIGTGMSVSSGIWTFPSTGLWWVKWNTSHEISSEEARYIYSELIFTNNDSSYVERSVGWAGIWSATGAAYCNTHAEGYINVVNVSNQKVKLGVNSAASAASTKGSSTANVTWVTFIRLGDSQ
tara:strand:+ start:106 stop:666 length:561 start_codon:yes stop_codon:yes gene_type:complete